MSQPVRPLFAFPGGIHPSMHKELSTQEPIEVAPCPPRLVLPLHQHIGSASVPTVAVGDRVLKGQRIARAEGYVSVALHAPTSGTISAISELPVPHPSGLPAPCMVLDADGEDRWCERQTTEDYAAIAPSHLRNLVRDAGIVGLGGAGFPSFIKLNPGGPQGVDQLILNGVECEPYITCDDMLIRERSNEILDGLRIMRHALQAKRAVIAIEDNKTVAYAALVQAANARNEDVEIVMLPTVYPQGSEKQLVEVLTGKEVPKNGLPIHIGIVVHNVATATAINRALAHGEPLISRIVTVTGTGVRRPRNLEVRLGTPIRQVLEWCGGPTPETERVIMGGPMMGFTVLSHDAPVIKTTNCLLVATARDVSSNGPVQPCIRCGACADACPASLLPQQLYWFARAENFEQVQAHNVFDCIECGCCNYVCPSNIPLVHYYRFAKTEIWSQELEKEKADVARRRHEFRLERIEREKNEKAERHKKKRDELTEVIPVGAQQAGMDAIHAAVDRARARKENAQSAQIPEPGNQSAKKRSDHDLDPDSVAKP